jgi:DNA-binding MurR/RpiR family transcriptional regulator
MAYQDQIRQARPEMSKSFAKLADFLLDSYIEASFMTATELAHKLNLDAATVVRFSQSLGYAGYPELQREIREHVKVDLMVRPVKAQEPDSIPGVVYSAMQELRETLERTQMSLDTDAISRLVEHIGKARRIVVLAEGPAQPAAYNLVYFLEQANFPVHIARPGLAGLARTIHTAAPQDLLIALDVANEAPYIAPALREARGKDIATAAIVGSPSLASSRSADIVLAARATANIGVEIVSLEAIIFALVQALRWHYADRYAGAEQAIAELSALFQ